MIMVLLLIAFLLRVAISTYVVRQKASAEYGRTERHFIVLMLEDWKTYGSTVMMYIAKVIHHVILGVIKK